MTAPVLVETGRATLKEIPTITLNGSQGENERLGGPLEHTSLDSATSGIGIEKAAQGSTSGDIGTVVSKAKRAATSLWILIHAQNCRVGGAHCPHQGCTEAKKVLLHLKTCPAVNGCECPVTYNGCHQARKLLAHHKRCRELRAKQAGMRRTQQVPQQHVCLVCSLVARHARNLLEGKSRAVKGTNPRKQVIASFTLKQTGPDSTVMIPRGLNEGSMPPPPPRHSASRSSSTSPIPIRTRNEDSQESMCSSPPPENQLLQFSAVAAAAAPPGSSPVNPLALGKSLDSSKSSFLTFAAGMLQKMKEAPSPADGRRSRAESLDLSSISRLQKARNKVAAFSAGNDPTLEFELRRSTYEDVGEGHIIRRGRSASLGVLVECALDTACPPIEEESNEVRDELDEQPFPMED